MLNLLKAFNLLLDKHLDKIAHLAIWALGTLWIALWWKIEAGIGIAVMAGVAKEFWDRYRHGKFSVADIVADILGIALAYLIFIGA